MKNKNTTSIALLFCLGLAAYFFTNNQSSISRSDRRDFAVSDTSQIAEIKITSKKPETATLKRVDKESWLINEEFRASKSSIYYLLKTLQRMEVAYPVPLSLRDNVLGNLTVRGLKVELFLEDGSEKIFYVGGENKELTATFMMLKDATDPYAVHIPGFRGYLSSRFFTNEYLWRDKEIMDYNAQSITSINMQFYDENDKNDSFHIDFDNESYELTSFDANENVLTNPQKVAAYRASFQELFAEAFITKPLDTDSLIKTEPIFDLTVQTTHHETHLKVFHKRADVDTNVKAGRIYDPERLYAYVNEKDWMIIQQNTFKKVIKRLADLK